MVDLDVLLTRPFEEFRDKKGELVSVTSQLKQTAADGKKYQTDTFDYDSIIEFAKNSQANRHIVLSNGLVITMKRSLGRANQRMYRKKRLNCARIVGWMKPSFDNMLLEGGIKWIL